MECTVFAKCIPVHACLSVYIHMYMQARGHEFESQMTLGIVPQLLSALFCFEAGSLTGLGTQQTGWPVSPRDPPVSASPVQGLRAYATMPDFSPYFWRSSSHLCPCTASASPSEPSLHPSTLAILTRSWERTQVPCQLPPSEFRTDSWLIGEWLRRGQQEQGSTSPGVSE